MSTLTTEPAVAAPRINRRSFLKRATLGAGAAALGLAGYSGLIEANIIDVTRLDLRISNLPPAFDGFKVAVISDLHFGPYTGARQIGAAVHTANGLKPDMVALLGDFVTESLYGVSTSGAAKAEPCAKVLQDLQSTVGSFAVLGNHDYATDPEFVAEALRSHGMSLLRNTNQMVEREGARVWLVGVNDAMVGQADLEQALIGVPQQETKILLAHEPDFADQAARYGIDVQLSGHSHGGQIRMPGMHPLWLPRMAEKYYRGYYRVRQLQLYTNRGIGTVALPFRFCAPPEVTLITLRTS
ncbi:MAG TPA: metallophosphoesterase [Terriglobales bacterium]|nr:metallophosphoesterase [Terriglobales bacterium]